MTPAKRFWAKVDKSGECWLWMAAKSWNGYGQFRLDRRTQYAHRIAYEWLKGSVHNGLQLDHLCRVRHCVNPAHLEPVTQRENILRGTSIIALCAQKTHCPQGHPYSGDNLYVTPSGDRKCRTCAREASRRQRALCAFYQLMTKVRA